MKVTPTMIDGLVVLEPNVFADDRGDFFETFNEDVFAALGLPTAWRQDSCSSSKQGVLRGLHFQLPPKPQAKLVRCAAGRVWDVAVDLRKASRTYKRHVAVELSAENKKMLLIPEGFAHGFYALTDAVFVYKLSSTFAKECDGGVAWNDPELGVPWPLAGAPLLSARDAAAPTLAALSLPF